MISKVITFDQIRAIVDEAKRQGMKIVHCHGVFDLLHPGHIRHLKEAKRQGDQLVVTVTPDRYVNKGPGRPVFHELLRIETLAALDCIDYVILNDSPDAVSPIQRIKPDVYVKGKEYQEHASDITGKIVSEEKTVKEIGGAIYYTDDVTFSSSALLNRYFDPHSKQLQKFLDSLKKRHALESLIENIEALKHLRILVVGDAIIDEYQYVEALGQSGKGLHMTARYLDKDIFLGGALIIANHIAQFSDRVTLLTAIGESCPERDFIENTLEQKIHRKITYLNSQQTLKKTRYVSQDGKNISKLFEVYSNNDALLDDHQTAEVISYIKRHSQEYDLVLVADFGNGFTNPAIIEALSTIPTFLAINTQTNSGNRGFNVITHYKRADFISLNEPELRLAAHDRIRSLNVITEEIAHHLHCSKMTITQGVNGVFCWSANESSLCIPALTTHAVDRVGAGDSFFSVAALAAAQKLPLNLVGFFGGIAAALGIQVVCNRKPIGKVAFLKFLTRLLK